MCVTWLLFICDVSRIAEHCKVYEFFKIRKYWKNYKTARMLVEVPGLAQQVPANKGSCKVLFFCWSDFRLSFVKGSK